MALAVQQQVLIALIARVNAQYVAEVSDNGANKALESCPQQVEMH